MPSTLESCAVSVPRGGPEGGVGGVARDRLDVSIVRTIFQCGMHRWATHGGWETANPCWICASRASMSACTKSRVLLAPLSVLKTVM